MDQDAPPVAARRSNVLALSLLLNAIMLGFVGYKQFGAASFLGDGVSLTLANDTGAAMLEVSLAYPGGEFKLPDLPADKTVGTAIPVAGVFDATLTFRKADGGSVSRPVRIKPIGELLIVLHVIADPVRASEEGQDQPASSPPGARVIVSYQGENVEI